MRPAHPKSKDQILALAFPLFANTGFDGISMRDIAQTVGMSAAALYYHFPDKQALYASVFIFAFQQKLKEIVEPFTATVETPQQQLLQLVERLFKIFEKDPEFCKLLERELLGNNISRINELLEQALRTPNASTPNTRIIRLMVELDTSINPYALLGHLLGLTLHHLEFNNLRKKLAGLTQKTGYNLDLIQEPACTKAKQVTALFLNSIGQRRQTERKLPLYV